MTFGTKLGARAKSLGSRLRGNDGFKSNGNGNGNGNGKDKDKTKGNGESKVEAKTNANAKAKANANANAKANAGVLRFAQNDEQKQQRRQHATTRQ